MEQPSIDILYQCAITLNADAFAAGEYSAAYHALMSALELAERLESDHPLLEVSRLAQEQLDWLDANHPEYPYSTPSTAERHNSPSIFALAASRAQTLVRIRIQHRRLKSASPSPLPHAT